MSCTIYTNPAARSWQYGSPADYGLIQSFHRGLPNYSQTPLVAVPDLARDFGIKAVFIKDESNRLNLPAYKILGASWGTFRAIAKLTDLPSDASLEQVAAAAQKLDLQLFAATEGNHGRAVARMAKILGIKASIFVASHADEPVKNNIASEGAQVTTIQGNYDDAVREATAAVQKASNGLLIQDVAVQDQVEVCEWIIEGYSTLLNEIEQQLADQNFKPTVIVTPIGAGSLGHAVTTFCKSPGRSIRVLAVEPEKAACLNNSLRKGKSETIQTSKTIMDGMNCGTVSPISWPVLQNGVDASVTITDKQCHEAVQYLHQHGVNAGPCGAGSLAALRKVVDEQPNALDLDSESVVVLLSTEGKRHYVVPEM